MKNAEKLAIALVAVIVLISLAITARFISLRGLTGTSVQSPEVMFLTSEAESEDNQPQTHDVFYAKSDILQRLSKITPTKLELAGLSTDYAKPHKFSEPFILIEELGQDELDNTDNISVNEFSLSRPNVVIVEKFLSAEKTEYPISISVLWKDIPSETELSKLDYAMWQRCGTDTLSYMRGNPDGTISLFFVSSDDNRPLLELKGEVKSGDMSVMNAQMTFRSSSFTEIKKIIKELRNLCGLKEPIKTGDWLWRSPAEIPWRIKDTIDGGLVKWHSIGSELEGVIECSAVTWNNGILISVELIVLKNYTQGVLDIFTEISRNTDKKFSGFSLNIEEFEHTSKITVIDDFVLNFSNLWYR